MGIKEGELRGTPKTLGHLRLIWDPITVENLLKICEKKSTWNYQIMQNTKPQLDLSHHQVKLLLSGVHYI